MTCLSAAGLLARAATLLGSLLLVALAGELALRLALPPADFGQDRVLRQRFHPHWKLHHRSAFGEYDTRFTYNSDGMRDRERAKQKTCGTSRILAIGDSFTEAREVERDEGFTAVLERLLAVDVPVEVINAGRSGLGAAEEYLVLHHFGIARQPDLVIQAFFMNDVQDDAWRRDRIEWDADGLPVRMLGVRSDFVVFVRDSAARLPFVWKRKLVARDLVDDPEADPFWALRHAGNTESEKQWATTLRMIEGAARLSEQHGAEYLLVVIPFGDQVDPTVLSPVAQAWDLGELASGRAPQDRIVRFASERGIAVLDLLPSLSLLARSEEAGEAGLYFPHDGHWTSRGHRAAAEILREELVSMGWVVRHGERARGCTEQQAR